MPHANLQPKQSACANPQTNGQRRHSIFRRSIMLGLGASVFATTQAHASNDVLRLAENPLGVLLCIAIWVTALSPCGPGSSRRTAALLGAIVGAALAHLAHLTVPWITATSLFCVALASMRTWNGFLRLLLATAFFYRRKFEIEDSVACSGVQGTLGGGGYRHNGISLRGQHASRSWS